MKDIILDTQKVNHTIKRLAYEIYENAYKETKIYLLGINNKGKILASKIEKALKIISELNVELQDLTINPSNPLEEIKLNFKATEMKNKMVIVVDDVANTGRTLFYACKPIMDVLPKRLEFAVLVDRKHKNFPVKVDYVGVSLATTLKEDISVIFDGDDTEVYFS